MINKLNKYLDNNNEFSQLVDLINISIKNDNDNIFILEKMLIVLMVTKLETFLENSTSNWFEIMKQDPLNTVYNLSDVVKQEIIKDTTATVYEELKNGKISYRNKNKINNFNILTDEFYPLSKIDIQFKITLNSHGSSEIKSLLNKIGLENIYNKMDQYYEQLNDLESLGHIDLTMKIDYEGNINKLINYRNKIIHEDILTNISYSDLNEFIDSLNLLARVVNDYINKSNIHNNIEYINQ